MGVLDGVSRFLAGWRRRELVWIMFSLLIPGALSFSLTHWAGSGPLDLSPPFNLQPDQAQWE
jgi:hypothetical protein